jgi:hypothetical protein
MALFRRSRSNRSSVPTWCAWFSAEDWAAFHHLVRECLAHDYVGQPRIPWGQDGSRLSELDLAQLAGWLRNQSREKWRATVAGYPQRCAARAREEQAQRAMPFASARGALLPRMRLAEKSEIHLDAMTRIVGGELIGEVQLRGEYADLLIRTDQTRRWDVSPAEVWSVAMANLRRQPCDVHEVVPGESPICAVLGSGIQTAAHVLRLDELMGRPTPYGAFVVLPRTDALAFWIINGPGLITAGPTLQRYGSKLRDLPQSPERRLSQQLFWWSDGTLESVTIPDWEADAAAGLGSRERPHTIRGSQRFVDLLVTLTSSPDQR